MKPLAQRFLTESEQTRVKQAVQEAEKRTAGEIACVIQSASYHYPMANVIGATALALPPALIGTPFLGGWLWLGAQNMWVFLALFATTWFGAYLLVDHAAALKRWFISGREIDEEVKEAAVTSFFREGLYRTRDATGVLIFISVFERKVWILADHGIHAHVPAGQWDGIVRHITDGIHQHRAADAICESIRQVAQLLEVHFPVRPDDTNELRDLIVSPD